MKLIKILLASLYLATIISIYIVFKYINTNFGYPPKLLVNTILTAYSSSKNTPQKINFLILGTDIRQDWLETNQDTDTIILASLDIRKNNINLVSIPRDLWFSSLNARVNKIYSLSINKPNRIDYIKQTFSQIIGQKIDHIIIINTDILSKLITIIGPVEVDLAYSFTDNQYPNPEYILDPVNFPNPYITIGFSQGINTIDSDNVDYFVRSRKGADSKNGGTDIGRSARQQFLIMALFNKIKLINPIKNMSTISSLYQLWSSQITKDVTDTTILSIFFKLNRNLTKLTFNNISLPIGLNINDVNGVIYHPNYFSQGAWVYLPTKNNFSHLWNYLDEHLN